MQRAELVAVGVAHLRHVQCTHAAFAHARHGQKATLRSLCALAADRDRGSDEGCSRFATMIRLP
jgi:hypothetical protein